AHRPAAELLLDDVLAEDEPVGPAGEQAVGLEAGEEPGGDEEPGGLLGGRRPRREGGGGLGQLAGREQAAGPDRVEQGVTVGQLLRGRGHGRSVSSVGARVPTVGDEFPAGPCSAQIGPNLSLMRRFGGPCGGNRVVTGGSAFGAGPNRPPGAKSVPASRERERPEGEPQSSGRSRSRLAEGPPPAKFPRPVPRERVT